MAGIGDLKDDNNQLTSDPTKKADLVHRQFDSVFSDDTKKITPDFDKKTASQP